MVLPQPTVWTSDAELPLKFPSPVYVAVTLWEPGVRADVAKLARPVTVFKGPLETGLPSTTKLTVPLGRFGGDVLGGAGLKVAVKVTVCPKSDGFCDEASAVFVSALLTVWTIAPDVLPPKLPSPLYTAVIEWMPTDSSEIGPDGAVAVAELTAPVAIRVAPS